MATLTRNSHFLGAKLRALRKRNNLTLDELSARCIQLDADDAPSVPYLSMIESGKRVPSGAVLALLARVFQREPAWFLDDNPELDSGDSAPAGSARPRAGGAASVPFEPAFLFSRQLLQAAIPELLTQTGTTGRQFAHLLIRSHQEMSRNDFPDLERAAESVGERQFPLSADDLMRLCRKHGLSLRWFERPPVLAGDTDRTVRSVVRSFYEAPHTIYLNKSLQSDPARLKFDLATQLGHKVLHGGDGVKNVHATGGEFGGSPESAALDQAGLNSHDVLHAWRDFECSFFAGALLCPKVPFRRFLARERYRVEAGLKLQLTPALVMRRMTKVSPYPYWHFFDAYPPGYLRAVYRGNGIPLPWGNMAHVSDPCPHWAVFRMLTGRRERSAQISLLREGERWLMYCCHTLRVPDMADNPHVLSVGIDLAPALRANNIDSDAVVNTVAQACLKHHGETAIPASAAAAIRAVAKVLGIVWVEESLDNPARIICPRSANCPRTQHCEGHSAARTRAIADVRREIIDRPGLTERRRTARN